MLRLCRVHKVIFYISNIILYYYLLFFFYIFLNLYYLDIGELRIHAIIIPYLIFSNFRCNVYTTLKILNYFVLDYYLGTKASMIILIYIKVIGCNCHSYSFCKSVTLVISLLYIKVIGCNFHIFIAFVNQLPSRTKLIKIHLYN